ncbi:MAG TPA: ACT domain-containing protein [Anaeromyxobacteraceae bacterium]|nr:ACT domain-containing protein [Anaeromyxobacteraceae bacterium]
MARAKELKVRVPDRPGMLGEIASALGEKKVNIRAVNGWVEGGEGVVRLVVDKAPAARKVLAARGWSPEEREVIELELADKPGALGAAARALGAAGVNIEHVFVGAGGGRKATLFLSVSDPVAAAKALRRIG